MSYQIQPTLSAGIQELEKILGAPVVDRARSGVILTAAGQEAVRRAQDILTRTEDLVQAARGAGLPLAGRFRLGVIPTVAPALLTSVIVPRSRSSSQVSVSGFSDTLQTFGGGVGQIAMHGTNRPELLGQPVSNGCVRMTNDAITKMVQLAPLGTPVNVVA